MKKFLLLLSIILLATISSFGQPTSIHYGPLTLSGPHTWNNFDIYYIDGNIAVPDGATLNILPNTGSSLPVYVIITGDYGFHVTGSGSLNISGTSSRNIYFTADRDADGVFGESGETWQNLNYDASTSSSSINYAVIEYGTGDDFLSGGGIDIYDSNIDISNTTIRNCSTEYGGGIAIVAYSYDITLTNLEVYNNTCTNCGGGIYVTGGAVDIIGCSIHNNTGGLISGSGVRLDGGSTISNSIIYDNSSSGVSINATEATLFNCLIYGNPTGVYFAQKGNIVNCDIINNGTGVNSGATPAPVLLNTVLWGNTTTQYTRDNIALANCAIQGGFIPGGTGIDGGGNFNLSATNTAPTGPNFINSSSDYHFGYVSPLIDGGALSYAGISAPAVDMENRSRISSTDIGAYEYLYYRWTGTSSTDWSTPGNWSGSPSPIPSSFSSTQVIIPTGCTNYPIASSITLSSASRMIIQPSATVAVTGAATVENGGLFTVEPLGALTVGGTTTVNTGGTFLLRSDVTGFANFIPAQTPSGSFTIQMYLTGGGSPNYAWHYVTTPVNGIGTAVLTTNISNPYNLLQFDETEVTTDKNAGWEWYDTYGGLTDGFSTLSNMQGYNVYVSTAQTAAFTGSLSTIQDYTWTNSVLTYTGTLYDQAGWHLIGNPFTCGVDVESFILGANINKTIYYTRNNSFPAYNLKTHAGINGGTNLIPPLQGFFIHDTIGSDKTLTIPASSRLISTASLFKGTSEVYDYPILKFNISDGSSFTDESLIYFFKDASAGFDGDYDAFKMLSNNPANPQIYTGFDNLKLAMNGLPYPDKKTVVPLSIKTGGANNYTFSILKLKNLNDYKVTLINGAEEIDLKANPSYTFYASKGTVSNMSIVFENITTDVNVPSDEQSACWYSNDGIMIKTGRTGFEDNSTVAVYDLNGRAVFNKNNVNITRGEIVRIPVSLVKGIYITSISNKGLRITKKIVVAN
jgi:hypothetical protein